MPHRSFRPFSTSDLRRRRLAAMLGIVVAVMLLALPAARLAAQDERDDDTLEVPVAIPDSIPTIVPGDSLGGESPTPGDIANDGDEETGGDSAAPAVLAYDSSTVALRIPSDSVMRRYRADNDFIYDREQEEPDSLWDRFLRWLRDLFRTVVGGGENETTIIEWILYAIAAAAVVFVILKLMGADIRSLFLRGSRARVSALTELDENIHEMDFDAMIGEAVAMGQYRRAVRLLYLKGLKALADKGAIDWRKDKTNRDYLHELRESPLRAPFADATLLFEYVWYGDMPINASVFGSVRENLEGFVTTINRRS